MSTLGWIAAKFSNPYRLAFKCHESFAYHAFAITIAVFIPQPLFSSQYASGGKMVHHVQRERMSWLIQYY